VNGYPDSYYAATARDVVPAPALSESVDTDVCVIGGGYTGLSAALHLRERGFSVVLLEAYHVGWGASGRNGGQLGSGQRQDETYLEKRFGRNEARLLWDMAEQAKHTVKTLVARHQIDCELTPGQLVAATKLEHASWLQERVERLQRAYGYQDIRFVDRAELGEMLGSPAYHAGSLDQGAAHLHPLNFALGLAAACRAAGVRIFEQSPATGYSSANPTVISTPNGRVRAGHLVLACNGYLGGLEPRLAGHIMPINNFMLATEPLGDDRARSLIRDNVCVHDTRFVVNYFRLSADGRLLFGGGESYTRRFPANLKAFVRPYMLRIFPQLEDIAIDYAWGGALAITISRLPHLGRLEPNQYFAHGFSGHGLAMGTFAGRLIAEALAGSAERFDVFAGLPTRRFPGGTLLRWPGMVLGMLYYALRDRL
jgi:gamma-glutamylputrescine oxidase